QSLKFRLPVKLGDTVTVKLEVTGKNDRRKIVTLDCKAYNQHDKLVLTGVAEVIAPEQKLTIDVPAIPNVSIED
ncbi:MAG: 3-hydroxybutyryl-CoA dehydratase, partial [Halioglobus sp.]